MLKEVLGEDYPTFAVGVDLEDVLLSLDTAVLPANDVAPTNEKSITEVDDLLNAGIRSPRFPQTPEEGNHGLADPGSPPRRPSHRAGTRRSRCGRYQRAFATSPRSIPGVRDRALRVLPGLGVVDRFDRVPGACGFRADRLSQAGRLCPPPVRDRGRRTRARGPSRGRPSSPCRRGRGTGPLRSTAPARAPGRLSCHAH